MPRIPIAPLLALLLSTAAFAGDTVSYVWFDLNTCTRYAVTSEEVVNAGAPKCFDAYHARHDKAGQVVEFSFDAKASNCQALTGTTYRVLRNKGDLKSFRCVTGCDKGAPPLVHEAGDEADVDHVNPEAARAFKDFNRQCAASSPG